MNPAEQRDQLVLTSGPNVRIRFRVRDDVKDEYRWRTDPDNAKYDGRPAYTEPFERFLDAFGYELTHGLNDREQFAIDSNDAEHIGTLMLYNFEPGGESAEFGISLGEESVRGRGLGREATITFLRWTWNNRPLRSVYLHVLEWNERAVRSFRAAGFGETARVLRDGQALLRMEVRREWWLLWEMEGRFDLSPVPESAADGSPVASSPEGLSASALER